MNDDPFQRSLNQKNPVVAATSRAAKMPAASPDAARLVTAAIGIPIVLWLVAQGGWMFSAVVGVLALIGMRELELAHRKASTPLVAFLAYPAMLAIIVIAAIYAHVGVRTHPGAPLVFFSLWLVPVALLTLGVLAYRERGKISLFSLALTNFAVMYVGLFAFLILLRGFPGGGPHLFWIVLIGVWTGDSFAYFGGRKWGKTPLTSLSPKKTREGIFIGVLLSCVIFSGLALWFSFAIGKAVFLGVLVAHAAPLGDLAESFWKRELDVKDLGALFPGHGGVLDRCDSLLFASFVVYLFALWRL
jgi:phosphatidate cytidylyltransferase